MRRGGAVVSQGVLVVCGVDERGYREVLGCWVAESESEASWGAVFAELKRRTRVVRIFPNLASCLRLVSALLIETIQQWMGRLYLRMEQDTATATHATSA